MKVLCSFCHAALGDKEPLDDDRVSHGACLACRDYFVRQWSGLPLSDFLDDLAVPVVAIEASGRVVGASQVAATMLGKTQAELVGLLGGEAMECVYARLPGGCGGTVHCRTCAIRRTVTETHADGQPRVDVPATLEAGGGPLELLISTELRDGLVFVRIAPNPSASDAGASCGPSA